MSSCDLVSWFVAGTLSADERQEFIHHLATCSECRSELACLMRFRARLCDEVSSLPPAPPTARNPVSEPTGDASLDLLGRIMRLVPVTLPGLSVRRSTYSLLSPFGRLPLGTLTMPEITNNTLAGWLRTTAGN
ncbi:MAG: zf-HC2 domain-containing protein [Thermaerobacter sp.]|nr:zf-HC2 domain-containing protein [Thermaerobacter sp.]